MKAHISPMSEMREQASLSNIWLKKWKAGMSFVEKILSKFSKWNSTNISAMSSKALGLQK